MKRLLLSAVAVSLCALATIAYGSASDYDPATGEPKCMDCHTPDRRYSTDYTRDETCAECHGPGLSDNYVEINGRFRDPSERNEIDRYAETLAVASGKGAVKGAAPKGMVLIPAGEFTMGSNEWWPKSQPEHSRMVGAFYIDRYEVTNQRYKAFVDAAGYPVPDHWKDGNIPEGKKDHPVVYVTWKDADNFCRWEGKRLPTEEEWEKAARGTDKRTFPWGDKFAREKGNTPQYGHEDTLPIGSFESGKSPYGLYDMAGNAFEWTESWFKPYPGNTHPDENYGEKYKVLKGGSWYDCTTYKCGISSPNYNRIFFHPTTKNNNFGFRCANDKK